MSKLMRHLRRNGLAYLIMTILGTSMSIYFLDLANMPRNEENIAIFVGSKGDNQNLLTMFETQKPDYLRRIQYRQYLVTADEFARNYRHYAYNLSDLVIIPQSKIIASEIPICYSLLNPAVMEEFAPYTNFYTLNNCQYGFRIHEKGTSDNYLLDYGQEADDEDYYAFITKGSIHGGSLSNSPYRTALDFILGFYL